MLLFSVVFGRFAGIPSDGKPYAVFVLCGLLPWQLFSFGLTQSANSLVMNERLVTKVYFPRLLLPLASILAGVVDFAITFLLLVGVIAYHGIRPGATVLLLPIFLGLAVVAALAVGVGLSALNAEFRDVRHALPFLAQLWLFATPIAYPTSLFPEDWRPLLGLNPMAGVVEGFRWALLGSPPPGATLGISIAVTIAALGLSLAYFARFERRLADVI
jgi:lipopolysaccharide transport system permease protein